MKTRGARLGQHFLKHGWAAAKLAHAIPMRGGEVFLEIGPGKGVLTKELLAIAPTIAVEKDEALVERLEETFSAEIAAGRLRLVAGDIRSFDPSSVGAPYVLAANIPYYITGDIMRQFLTATSQPRAMALLMQKEVAERIVARGGKESILSLSVRAFGTPRIAGKVGRSHFSPPPRVDSAILVIEHISKRFFEHLSEKHFFDLVRKGFSSKRKMLAGNLSVGGKAEEVRAMLQACGIPRTARAEDVDLAQWRCLAERYPATL